MSFSLTRNRIRGTGFRDKRFSIINPTTFTNSLEAYYKFDNNGLDSSDKGRDLVYTGTEAYAAGILDNGYSLPQNGANFAEGPNDSVLGFVGSGAKYTLGVWINTGTNNSQTIVEKLKTSAPNEGWSLGLFNRNGAGSLTFRAQNLPGGFLDTAGSVISTSTLHYIVVRSDGTTVKIFVDAIQRATVNHVSNIDTSLFNLLVGQRAANGGGPFSPFLGVIDELAIWSRDLSTDEIFVLHNGGVGLPLF